MLSVEPWLVEQFEVQGWKVQGLGFSALSRAVVGGTIFERDNWTCYICVSVLSVEPWLVEPEEP